METIKKSTISGFNEVVQTIRETEKQFTEQQHFITLVTFNGNGIRTKLEKEAAVRLRPIDVNTYHPGSSTPLFDAIGLSVVKLKYDLAGRVNTNVLVTILTDGEENASREFNGTQIRKLIDELTASGWTFTYIGANHDVEKMAYSLSITNTMTFYANEDGVKEMFEKEKYARKNYAQNLRDKRDVRDDYYKGN
jgi:hypothetical protein